MDVVPNNDLTAVYVKALFEYNPNTGDLVWKAARGRARVGDVAGSKTADGYIRVKINGVSYLVHRLVWLIHHGRWPADQVDHINGNRACNRIENLRAATRAENQQNRVNARGSSSLFLGVSWHKQHDKWEARINANGKCRYLGLYNTEEAAATAYAAAKEELHLFNPKVRQDGQYSIVRS